MNVLISEEIYLIKDVKWVFGVLVGENPTRMYERPEHLPSCVILPVLWREKKILTCFANWHALSGEFNIS